MALHAVILDNVIAKTMLKDCLVITVKMNILDFQLVKVNSKYFDIESIFKVSKKLVGVMRRDLMD